MAHPFLLESIIQDGHMPRKGSNLIICFILPAPGDNTWSIKIVLWYVNTSVVCFETIRSEQFKNSRRKDLIIYGLAVKDCI